MKKIDFYIPTATKNDGKNTTVLISYDSIDGWLVIQSHKQLEGVILFSVFIVQTTTIGSLEYPCD